MALSKVLAIIVLAILALLALLWTWGITLRSIGRAIQNRPRPDLPTQDRTREDPATVVVNHIANKHIAHLERKRQTADFDIPVDGLPVGQAPKKERRKASAPDASDSVQQEKPSKSGGKSRIPLTKNPFLAVPSFPLPLRKMNRFRKTCRSSSSTQTRTLPRQ